MHHRDVERRVQLACIVEDEQGVEGFEPADEHEAVEVVLLETGGDGTEVDVGKGTVRPELGATAGGPAVDTEPGEFVDVVVEETTETIVHGEGDVTLLDTVTDCRAGGGVHPSSRSTNATMDKS